MGGDVRYETRISVSPFASHPTYFFLLPRLSPILSFLSPEKHGFGALTQSWDSSAPRTSAVLSLSTLTID